eukprot:14921335-Alexandrium_andersonii.AAC.1
MQGCSSQRWRGDRECLTQKLFFGCAGMAAASVSRDSFCSVGAAAASVFCLFFVVSPLSLPWNEDSTGRTIRQEKEST